MWVSFECWVLLPFEGRQVYGVASKSAVERTSSAFSLRRRTPMKLRRHALLQLMTVVDGLRGGDQGFS